ncbi:MAG: hypothetical protein GXP43_03460 [bacterium]|nr:hypothetical protein [bacterium]
MKRFLPIFVWWGVGVVLFGMGLIGAYSYFSSETQITDNTLSFGTLVMKLDDKYDSLTAVWNGSNLKPGDSISGSFKVSNSGSLEAEALGLGFANSGFKTSNSPTLDYKLRLTSLKYDGVELIKAVEAALAGGDKLATTGGVTITANLNNGLADLETVSDGYLSLGELNNKEIIIKSAGGGGLNGLKASSGADVKIELMFVPGSNDNDYQADAVVTNITGTLYQVAP